MGKKLTQKPKKNSLNNGKNIPKNINCLNSSKRKQKNLTKTGLLNIGNSCYISSVFQAIAHLKIHSTLPNHSELSILLNSLSDIESSAICPMQAIREINDLWDHQNLQEDAFEFLMTILPLMQSEKFTYEYLCQRFCEICNYNCEAVVREDCSHMMVINEKTLQEQLNGTVEPIDEICSKCGKGYMMLYRNIMKAPNILVVRIMRFTINQKTGRACKIWNKVALPSSIFIGAKRYKLEIVILHKSKTLNHGHYTVYFPQKKILIDDEKVIYNKTFKLDHSYFYVAFYI